MTMCTFSNGGYPLGAANDPRAPYNQKDPEIVKVNVTVSVTYSRSFDIFVEEGYTNKDLVDAVEELGILPNSFIEKKQKELEEELKENTWLTNGQSITSIKEDMKKYTPWHEDELEVIENF